MKYITPFFILFFAFFGILHAQDKPANPDALSLFIEGKTLELQDNYIAAISKYNDALKIEKAPGIYYTLSKLYYNVSQYQKALENGLAALKLSPGNADYMENIADDYIILNNYKNAVSYLNQVAQKKPDDINILYNIGRIYEAQKQPSEAIKLYFRDHRINEAFEKYGRLMNQDSVDFNTKIQMAVAFLDASANDPEALGASKSILQTLQTSYPSEWAPEFYLGMIDAKENNT